MPPCKKEGEGPESHSGPSCLSAFAREKTRCFVADLRIGVQWLGARRAEPARRTRALQKLLRVGICHQMPVVWRLVHRLLEGLPRPTLLRRRLSTACAARSSAQGTADLSRQAQGKAEPGQGFIGIPRPQGERTSTAVPSENRHRSSSVHAVSKRPVSRSATREMRGLRQFLPSDRGSQMSPRRGTR